MSDERFMTTKDVAEALHAPAETVRYWRHVGKGPKSFKIGRRVLYAVEDVEAFIASERAAGHHPAQLAPDHVRLGRPEPKRGPLTRGRKPTIEEAEAILALVRGGWLKIELTLDEEER